MRQVDREHPASFNNNCCIEFLSSYPRTKGTLINTMEISYYFRTTRESVMPAHTLVKDARKRLRSLPSRCIAFTIQTTFIIRIRTSPLSQCSTTLQLLHLAFVTMLHVQLNLITDLEYHYTSRPPVIYSAVNIVMNVIALYHTCNKRC